MTSPDPKFPVPHIPGYTTTERLYQGRSTAVYRAVREDNQDSVVVKVLQHDYPSFNELVQFRNQYAVVKHLPIAGIVRSLALEPYGNGYALLMEDWGAISLGQYVKQQTLTLLEVLSLGIQLAETLHELRQHRVIHKDIKPANILIRPDSMQVKLIDFSIASLLPKETQALQNPNTLEGTLAYLAPEQTGRMNRGIDYRADYYALGVTLYQLLTGELPFAATDPLEMVHCHIAKVAAPVSQIDPAIPSMVAGIVAKLMAKNAEDRYQSALGLKYDLERCVAQLEDTGDVTSFKLGQRDLCDRFTIPEKLYGRDDEVQTLLDAFDRVTGGTAELMLVAGFSGIGKTAVVNEVHKPIARQRGYFIKGKFDQFNRNIPLSAFVQALRDLMGQLLSESDRQLQHWKAKILEAVGDSGQVLIAVIPELEHIIGTQPEVPELNGSAAENRFNRLFGQFISIFTTAEHPLTLFIDDLQWADSASLKLMKVLMEDNGYLLMLGAYRDNEVSPAHPFVMTVDELQQAGKTVNTITLNPLAFEDTNDLIADTLHCSPELAQPLTELVDRKTKGNPFFTTQFLKALYEDRQIAFERDRGHWECDIARVNALAITDDVVEFMATQLKKLPDETQDILKLAACIGNQFDLETLAIISEQSPADAAACLWKVLQEGSILPISQIYKFFQGGEPSQAQHGVNPTYRFLHDRVQQAAYSLISQNNRQSIHLQIGERLLAHTSARKLENHLFQIVNQLNQGSELISDPQRRLNLATLNLQAGQKARLSTAYGAAIKYFSVALEQLGDRVWQEHYPLALTLYEALAESEYLNGNHESSEAFIQKILTETHQLSDRRSTYRTLILLRISQGRMLDGIDLGIDLMQRMGIEIVESLSPEILSDSMTVEKLMVIPEMQDENQLFAMELLMLLLSPSFNSKPDLCPQIAYTMVELSHQCGLSKFSAFGYSLLSVFSCDLSAAEKAIALLDKFEDTSIRVRSLLLMSAHVYPWFKHISTTVEPLSDVVKLGLDVGDLEYTAYGIMHGCGYRFLIGEELDKIGEFYRSCSQLLRKINQTFQLEYNSIFEQLVLNLQGKVECPEVLDGEVFQQERQFPIFIQQDNHQAVFVTCLAELMLTYHAGNFEKAATVATFAQSYQDGVAGLVHLVTYKFYAALAWLANWPNCESEEQAQYLETINSYQAEIKDWAMQAPMNFDHQHLLIEAEKQSLSKETAIALELYDQSIEAAKENSYRQEEALANELAAKFYLKWDKGKVAAGYMQEAYSCYARWGAKAKTDHLEATYPQLLAPILQQPQSILSLNETTILSSPPTIHTSDSDATSILDISAAIKASQVLSGEIQLEALLSRLMRIVIETAGADKGSLVLKNDDVWEVVAQRTGETFQFIRAPLDTDSSLPTSMVRAVQRTQKDVILNQVKQETRFASDPYLTQQQPQSVLCAPILNQGQLIGVLYLENNLSAGAFTQGRIDVLNLVCSQAAISIENARLYEESQEINRKLQQSLEDVKNAQLQMVKSEKMSALGNLVAGIAHEINNPIAFIGGNLKPARDYVQDLLGLIDSYQEEHPNPSEALEEVLEAVDLDFLREDLPKLIDSMGLGVDRITHISTSLRTFSRTDKEHKVLFNLHEGIDSTLLILKHRLKANEQRPEIKIFKEYGDIPEVQCFPGQLNQVFMNLIANAIDALEEGNGDRSFEEIAENPNQIRISTEVTPQAVTIRIGDNGVGMTDEVKERIFEQGFTTKDVGKGTGLGMAIAQQIIEEQHGGTLNVFSAPGKGTQFAIALQLEPANNSSSQLIIKA